MIQFPSKPDYHLMGAEFDVQLDRVYRVRLTKTLNGGIEYAAECLTEDVSKDVKDLVEAYVVADAKKQGVFQPKEGG